MYSESSVSLEQIFINNFKFDKQYKSKERKNVCFVNNIYYHNTYTHDERETDVKYNTIYSEYMTVIDLCNIPWSSFLPSHNRQASLFSHMIQARSNLPSSTLMHS